LGEGNHNPSQPPLISLTTGIAICIRSFLADKSGTFVKTTDGRGKRGSSLLATRYSLLILFFQGGAERRFDTFGVFRFFYLRLAAVVF